MITSISKSTDETTGNILISFQVRSTSEVGVFKWTRHETASQILSQGIEVGELVGGEDVSNKPNFPKSYVFKFRPVALKKQEKTIDKLEEKVILKKTRSRKPKTTGG